MASSIGIKIANEEFYPLIEENNNIKKKLILTTVHDNQSSVQIDLYRSNARAMAEAQYIGTLVVENIKPRPKGEPSIEMVVSSNTNGEIIADAIDLDASDQNEHYILTVSLKSVDETSKDMDISDFDLDNEEPPLGLYNHAKNIRKEKERKSVAGLFVLLLLIIILGLTGVWLFFFGGLDIVQKKWPDIQRTIEQKVIEPAKQLGNKARQLFSKESSSPVFISEPVRQPAPVQQIAEPAPVVESPKSQVVQTPTGRSPPPVASYNVPAVIPNEGVNYKIRWGDTLWDISEAFYRNPWLYPRIARHNNIRNPNYIISGRIIRIPPKN
jgi:LysM repeat protein